MIQGTKNFKLAICIPFVGKPSLRWALSLRLLKLPPHIFIIISTYNIAQSREELVLDALDMDCSHILFIDMDTQPEQPDAVYRALNDKYPFVCGSYWLKKGHWCGAVRVKDGYIPLKPPTSGLPILVDYTGLGFSLIDIRIFKMLKRPWFVFQRELDRELPPVFTTGLLQSEDAYFCNRTKTELGIKPLIDPRIRLLHSTEM